MRPSIIFLGTGQGADVVGKQILGSGGIVVQTADHQIHIDPGPSSLLMARENHVNPRATTSILVSHSHINHCNDVNVLIDAMTLSGLDKKGVLISNNLLINGDILTRPYLTEFHKHCLEKYMVLKEGQKAAIDDIEIMATATKHSVECIGFRIDSPDFILSYLADTEFVPEHVKQHQGCDILILNVVYPFEAKKENNLNSADAVKIINKLRPKLAIVTHFSKQMLDADILLESRRINRETKAQVVAAKDGMAINPLTYSSKRTQTLLKGF
ncbi:MBL fold metallo-hydrolase [Candidatus Woesearchaeota archaeon]|nr:MBL fold metallo-hydrolase [Candidatus Woesearchaeota archaeon]